MLLKGLMPVASVFGYASAYFMALYMDLDLGVLTVTKISVTWYLAWACFIRYPKLNMESFGLKKGPIYGRLIYMGMICCGVGDIFLELEPWYPKHFFLFGLSSFFFGHLFYILAFASDAMIMKNAYKTVLHDSGANPYFIGCYSFAVGMCYFLIDGIPSGLVIPVIIYAFTISSMLYTTLKRLGMPTSSDLSQKSAAIGAASFVLSDSILAINKFHTKIPYAKFLIMITYFFAQICISLSCYGGGRGAPIKSKKKKS